MTVVDFRSGGYDGVRGRTGHGTRDDFHDDDLAHDWPIDTWDDARQGTDGMPARLTDRDSVLGRVARLTHYLGALVSVLLMCALAVWGYRLVVRDVSGVPVIRAVEGDARVAPEHPGGELTDRTGLAVNAVAAGSRTAPVERVAIAPAPTALSGQDVAMGELGATAHEPAPSDQPLADDTVDTVALTDAEAARMAAEQAAAEQAAQAQTAALAQVPAVAPADTDAEPVGAAVTTADGKPTQDTAITAALAEAGAVPPVVSAGRPAPRPRRLAAAAPASDAAPATAPALAPVAAPEPVAAARLAAGAPLVQIGAFDSNAIAQSEFTRVSGRFGALFSGKAPVVQEHRVNGRTFYRLRVAGFDSREDARRFCAALIEAGTDCIPAAAK